MDYKDTEKEQNIGADPENVVGKDALGEYEKESCGTNDYREEDSGRDDYEETDYREEDLEEDDYEENDYREEDSEEDYYEEEDYREEDSVEEKYEKTLYRKNNAKEEAKRAKYRPHYLDEGEDEDDIEYVKKKKAGDIIFRIVFGILVFAICITAAIAALLATGHLNGLIDKIESVQTAGEAPESEPDVTPTVRVTLTPTPAATATPEATETPKPTTSPDTSKAESTDTSKAEGTDSSGADTADVMTFHEVNDVVTAKETTNLRNVPSQGEESFIVYILQNGETVNRTGMSDEGWSRLDYNGQVVYAMSNLLTTDLTKKETTESGTEPTDDSLPAVQTVFTDVNQQVTPKIEVNLRLLPSVTNPKATVVATIKNGEVVTMTGVNEELGWCRVEYNGQTLYCISSYVEPVTSEPAAQESAAQEAAAPAA